MIDSFSVLVEYTQILVHISSHPTPGLLWSDEHVAQGFAWSEGLVSFGVPDHDGECLINIISAQDEEVHDDAIWAIQVPFSVSESLKIGTVFDTRLVNVTHGSYNLIFEVLSGDENEIAYKINLKFAETDFPEFAVLKQGGELTTDTVLRKDADLAG